MHCFVTDFGDRIKKKQNTFGCDHNHLPYFRRLNVLQFELQSIWLMIKCTVLFPFISLFTVSVDSIYSMQAMHCISFFFLVLFFHWCRLFENAIGNAFVKFWYIVFGLFCTIFGRFSVIFYMLFSCCSTFSFKRRIKS